ncbi:MAG: 50S ribosomal protein L33 [Tenericutes bacterium]|nr:MAG: 50S ribosomal protein L33 [Mycoplasmatota bacterium]
MRRNNKVILVCAECLNRNYSLFKSENNIRPLELKKFCSTCNKHTLHKETR